MENVLLVAYLLIVLALIAVILLQRSEGGGLGMGSANSNGLVSARGSANLLTRTTAVLATLFFVTAIGLTILAEINRSTSDILGGTSGDGPTTVLEALSQMGTGAADTLALPSAEPAAAAPAAADPATTEDLGLALPLAADPAPAEETPAPAAENAVSSAPAQ